MKYYKTDNYISDFECEELINDAEKLLDDHNFIEVQNNMNLNKYKLKNKKAKT